MSSSVTSRCISLAIFLSCLGLGACSTTPQPVVNPFPTPPTSLMQPVSPLRTLPLPSQPTTRPASPTPSN